MMVDLTVIGFGIRALITKDGSSGGGGGGEHGPRARRADQARRMTNTNAREYLGIKESFEKSKSDIVSAKSHKKLGGDAGTTRVIKD